MPNAACLVDLWLAGFAAATVLQTLCQRYLSSKTFWGFAPGWQREIAIWNISLIALIISLRVSLSSPDAAILPALALLSLLLGINHLVPAINEPKKTGHWAGVAGNFLGVLLYLGFVIVHH